MALHLMYRETRENWLGEVVYNLLVYTLYGVVSS